MSSRRCWYTCSNWGPLDHAKLFSQKHHVGIGVLCHTDILFSFKIGQSEASFSSTLCFLFPWVIFKRFFPLNELICYWTKASVQCNVFGSKRLQRSLTVNNWLSDLFILPLKNAYHGLELLHLKLLIRSISSVIAEKLKFKTAGCECLLQGLLLTAWNLIILCMYYLYSPTVFSA